jgi:hypothetical protein
MLVWGGYTTKCILIMSATIFKSGIHITTKMPKFGWPRPADHFMNFLHPSFHWEDEDLTVSVRGQIDSVFEMLCDSQSNIVIGRGWSAVRREDGLPLYLSSWSHGSLYVSERHARFGPRWACSTSQVQTFDDNSAAEIVSTVGRDLLTRLECGLRHNL